MASKPIRLTILANASKAKAEVEQFSKKLAGISGKVTKGAAIGLGIAGAAALKFGSDAVKAASDAQQSLGATETVFGNVADQIVKNSERAATAVGLSANAYRENANLIGSLFSNKGLRGNELAKQTDLVIKKGADLSATFGGTATEAVEALSSAFKGEFDPLERYGISIKQSTINTEAAALAQKQYGKDLDDLTVAQQNAIQRQATMDLINKQSAKSTGAFSRETNTLAHQQQVLGAKFEDIKAKVGTALLPVITKVTAFVSDRLLPAMEDLGPVLKDKVGAAIDLVRQGFEKVQPVIQKVTEFFAKNPEVLRNVAIALGVVAGAMIGVNVAMGIFAALTSPIFLVVAAIALLVGGLTLAYKRSETFRNIVNGSFQAIKKVVAAVLPPIKKTIVVVFTGIATYFRTVFTVYKTLFTAAWGVIKRVTSVAFAGVKNLIIKPMAAVVSYIGSVPGKITALGSKFKRAGSSIMNKIIEGIKGAAGFIGNIASGIWNAVKGLLNGAIDKINSALEFKISLPLGKSVTINPPNIPHLAQGGITSGPTLAVVGDNPGGREAVIPLDKYDLSGGSQLVPLLAAILKELQTQKREQHFDLGNLRDALAWAIREHARSQRKGARSAGRSINRGVLPV